MIRHIVLLLSAFIATLNDAADLTRIPVDGECAGFVDYDSGKIFENNRDFEECKRYCIEEPLCRAVTLGEGNGGRFPHCWFHYASYSDCISVANAHGVFNACYNWVGSALPSRSTFQTYVFSQEELQTIGYACWEDQCWYKTDVSLADCMNGVDADKTPSCAAVFEDYFNQLDLNGDGQLSTNEREVLFSEIIDELILPAYFPQGSNDVCTFDHFCDTMVTLEFPKLPDDVDDDILAGFCHHEQLLIDQTCANDWNVLFPGRQHSYMTKAEYRVLLMNTFIGGTGDWNYDRFLILMQPTPASKHLTLLLNLEADFGLPVVRVEDYTEPVNNCGALSQGRRELLVGVFLTVVPIIIGSALGAGVENVASGNAGNVDHFLQKFLAHGASNAITAAGCSFGPAGCAIGGFAGGLAGALINSAFCGDDASCWNVDDYLWSANTGAIAGWGGNLMDNGFGAQFKVSGSGKVLANLGRGGLKSLKNLKAADGLAGAASGAAGVSNPLANGGSNAGSAGSIGGSAGAGSSGGSASNNAYQIHGPFNYRKVNGNPGGCSDWESAVIQSHGVATEAVCAGHCDDDIECMVFQINQGGECKTLRSCRYDFTNRQAGSWFMYEPINRVAQGTSDAGQWQEVGEWHHVGFDRCRSNAHKIPLLRGNSLKMTQTIASMVDDCSKDKTVLFYDALGSERSYCVPPAYIDRCSVSPIYSTDGYARYELRLKRGDRVDDCPGDYPYSHPLFGSDLCSKQSHYDGERPCDEWCSNKDTASTRAFGVFAICDSDDTRRCCADGFLRCNPGLRSNNFPFVQSLAAIQNSDLVRIPGHGDCVGFVDYDSGKIFQNTGDFEECKRYCEGEPLCRAVTVGDNSNPAAFSACWFYYASYNDCLSVANAHGAQNNACFNWAGTGLPSRNTFQSYVFSQSQFETFSYAGYSGILARSRQCWYKSGYSGRRQLVGRLLPEGKTL